MLLDLASLKSVRSFAEDFLQSESRLDLLINNAGELHFSRVCSLFRDTSEQVSKGTMNVQPLQYLCPDVHKENKYHPQ